MNKPGGFDFCIAVNRTFNQDLLIALNAAGRGQRAAGDWMYATAAPALIIALKAIRSD